MTRSLIFHHHNTNIMVMEQYPQDDLGQGYSIDQNKMLSAKVSPNNFEQADTPVDAGQPQTAAPFQQSHPSLWLSQLSESKPQDSPGHTQGVIRSISLPLKPLMKMISLVHILSLKSSLIRLLHLSVLV